MSVRRSKPRAPLASDVAVPAGLSAPKVRPVSTGTEGARVFPEPALPSPRALVRRSKPRPDPRTCPECGERGSVSSVTSPLELRGTEDFKRVLDVAYDCPRGHAWTRRKTREDVCDHGQTSAMACEGCGRSWLDVADAQVRADAEKREVHEVLIAAGKLSRERRGER